MKKGDMAVALLTGLFLLIWLFPKDSGEYAAIYVDGKLQKKLPLNTQSRFVVESEFGTNTVVIENGKVSVSDSDCPNKDCEKTVIGNSSQSIVCLPNRLSVIIEGDRTPEETDVII